MDKPSLKRWCPSHQAIAWIYTGDENFALELGDESIGLWCIEFALELKPQLKAQRSPLLPANAAAAQKILATALAQEDVQTEGAYFERRSCLDGAGVIEHVSERDLISLSKLRGLKFYQDDQFRQCLIRHDDFAARGSNWRNLRGYCDIHHNTADIRRLLQQKECKQGAKPRAAGAAVRTWVENYFTQTKPPSQSDAWSQAREVLKPSPTRDQFEMFYREVADRRGIEIRPGKPRKA
jgi:hypothetical protein